MMLKKNYKEQRDHLGAHLKNSVSKTYQIMDGILHICHYARKGRIGKGSAFKEIEKLATSLKQFNDVPANVSYKFSPMGVFDNEKTWEKEKNENKKFLLSKKDADYKIYPTAKDFKKVFSELKNN
tara:strand:+ start:7227 stop:7601 length:375 start_codon:yes stop_codon:yes gene_type:complete